MISTNLWRVCHFHATTGSSCSLVDRGIKRHRTMSARVGAGSLGEGCVATCLVLQLHEASGMSGQIYRQCCILLQFAGK